jgi:hypothetical protein
VHGSKLPMFLVRTDECQADVGESSGVRLTCLTGQGHETKSRKQSRHRVWSRRTARRVRSAAPSFLPLSQSERGRELLLLLRCSCSAHVDVSLSSACPIHVRRATQLGGGPYCPRRHGAPRSRNLSLCWHWTTSSVSVRWTAGMPCLAGAQRREREATTPEAVPCRHNTDRKARGLCAASSFPRPAAGKTARGLALFRRRWGTILSLCWRFVPQFLLFQRGTSFDQKLVWMHMEEHVTVCDGWLLHSGRGTYGRKIHRSGEPSRSSSEHHRHLSDREVVVERAAFKECSVRWRRRAKEYGRGQCLDLQYLLLL